MSHDHSFLARVEERKDLLMECGNVCEVRGGGVGLVFAVRWKERTEDFVALLLEDPLQLREAGWLVSASVDEDDEWLKSCCHCSRLGKPRF